MTVMAHYPITISELAYLFPDLPEDEWARLVASTANLGPAGPVTIWRNQIVDGRQFYKAALETGTEPLWVFLDDSADPLTHIIENTVRGREHDENAKGVAAYNVWRLSNRPWPGEDENPCAILRTPLTQAEAARICRCSRRTLTDVAKVMDDASPAIPELRQALMRNRVKSSDGARVAGLPQEVQRAALQLVLDRQCRTVREAAGVVQREAARQSAAPPVPVELPASVVDSATLYVSGLDGLIGQVPPASVDVVVTRAPVAPGPLAALPELARFAAHALGEAGLLLVLADTARLPEIHPKLGTRHLRWVWQFHLLFPCPVGYTEEPHRLGHRHMPLLIYGRDGCRLGNGDDVIEVPAVAGGAMDREQMLASAVQLSVRRFAKPGQVVCAPMLEGVAGVAQGALAAGCTFIGASEDRPCAELAAKELEQFADGMAGTPRNAEEGVANCCHVSRFSYVDVAYCYISVSSYQV